MSRIQSSVGLVSGIPIEDTVNQLMQIASRPRDLLASRLQETQGERAAVDTLSALVLGLRSSLSTLSLPTTFSTRNVSSTSDAVSVSIQSGATPPVASYDFTPLQTASANQFVSQSFASLDDLGSAGTLDFQVGGHVDGGIDLNDLNGGQGFNPGRIRITDESGATETIDLRGATKIDDVINAINTAEEIDVTASTSGGRLVLTDNSGGSGTLRVREIGLGTTAESLGLDTTASGSTLTGDNIYQLGNSTRLSALNDGLGVRITNDLTEVDDLVFTLRDGTGATESVGVDLSNAATIADVVDAINNDADLTGKVTAEIGGDGLSLQVEDLTSGAGTFSIANGTLGSAADDLGLTGNTTGSTISGSRVLSGLRDTLVSNLNGGQGFTLESIVIDDRNGGNATIDLSGAETLEEIINEINNTGAVNVTASINESRSGILITDNNTTITSNLTISNGTTGTTATDLGIEVDASTATQDGGSLSRSLVSEATSLASLNGGTGIDLGDFLVTSTDGTTIAVDLNTAGDEAETLGDVIDRINTASSNTSAGITASINSTGDGILLTDTAGGTGSLTVAEVGNGTTAADLNLLGSSTTNDGSGNPVIDGTSRYSIDLSNLDQSAEAISLSTLNEGSGVNLGIFNVTTADGNNFAVNLGEAGSEAFTIGDVINLVNQNSGGSVTATVNSAGTGILLTDNTTGSGELTVEDLGSGTGAADLNLIRTSADTNDNEIDGSGLFSSNDDRGALQALADEINNLGAGIIANVFEDSSGFRLSVTSETTGADNSLLLNTGGTNLSLTETSRATDAVSLIGSSGLVATSSTNEFLGVFDGLDVSVSEADGQTSSISVATDTSVVTNAVQSFVSAFNSIVDNIDTVTEFDDQALTTGILFGRSEPLSVESDLARLVTGTFTTSAGTVSLESIGISIGDDGKLSLDQSELTDALNEDAAAIQTLFSEETTGVVAQFNAVTDRLAADSNSLLSIRSETLQRQVESFENRIEDWDGTLERQRERLTLDFVRLEETIALLQSNLDAIESIQPIAITTSSS